MRVGDRALMGAEQPSFEQGHDQMDTGQPRVGRFGMVGDKRDAMAVPMALHPVVAEPAVGMDHAARLNDLVDEALQAVGRGMRHPPQTNPPNPAAALRLRRDDNERLRERAAPIQNRLETRTVYSFPYCFCPAVGVAGAASTLSVSPVNIIASNV